MKTVQGLKNKSILVSGLLSIGILGSSLPALGAETPITNPNPLIPTTGSIEDLTGVEQRSIAQDLGGIGGTSEDLQIVNQSDLQPEMSSYEAKTRAINLTLERSDERLGDTSRITRRLPLIGF